MRVPLGQFRTTNTLLAKLPPEELATLRPFLSRSRLVSQQRLVESGHTAEHVYFIEEGIASLMAEAEAHDAPVQVAMIGREGMVGALSLLGSSAAYACTIMQVPGPALRISTMNLLACFESCPALRIACLEAVQSLARQIMSTAASNARNTLTERCVRWLLMAHDRLDDDDLPVTHEALAAMLGVRRSGVTVATAALHEAGLIRTGRGRIRVIDRAGLEAISMRRPVPRRKPVASEPGRAPYGASEGVAA